MLAKFCVFRKRLEDSIALFLGLLIRPLKNYRMSIAISREVEFCRRLKFWALICKFLSSNRRLYSNADNAYQDFRLRRISQSKFRKQSRCPHIPPKPNHLFGDNEKLFRSKLRRFRSFRRARIFDFRN